MRIWIDLDNSPHGHFFAPLVRQLEEAGYGVLITVRRFGQVEEIAQSHGLQYVVIGRHRTPRFFLTRVLATVVRALQLAVYGRKSGAAIAVNHGSRAHVLAAWLLRIPVMTIYDYEFVSSGLFSRMATKILLPEAVPSITLGRQRVNLEKVIRYPGYKENVYLSGLRFSSAIIEELRLDPMRLIITLRPPATWAHYHNAHSEVLFRAVVERLRGEQDSQIVVLPRTREQGEELRSLYGMRSPPFWVAEKSVDALSLMAHSDAVVGGGGTMTREAAIIGTPAYSLFAGTLGAIDAELEREGKLNILRKVEEVKDLRFEKNVRVFSPNGADARTGEVILQHIITLGDLSTQKAELRSS